MAALDRLSLVGKGGFVPEHVGLLAVEHEGVGRGGLGGEGRADVGSRGGRVGVGVGGL